MENLKLVRYKIHTLFLYAEKTGRRNQRFYAEKISLITCSS